MRNRKIKSARQDQGCPWGGKATQQGKNTEMRQRDPAQRRVSKEARRMTEIEGEAKKCNSRQMNKWRGVLRGEDVSGVQISPPLRSEKAEIRGSWLKSHCRRKEAPMFSIRLTAPRLIFMSRFCQNEREPEGNGTGGTGSKHTKMAVLRDWDGEREQMQNRLRGRLRERESSSSNYQTLNTVSLPDAALQGTKCKITLLHAHVDNCIRKG